MEYKNWELSWEWRTCTYPHQIAVLECICLSWNVERVRLILQLQTISSRPARFPQSAYKKKKNTKKKENKSIDVLGINVVSNPGGVGGWGVWVQLLHRVYLSPFGLFFLSEVLNVAILNWQLIITLSWSASDLRVTWMFNYIEIMRNQVPTL